jgi:hypothetical protein
MKKDKAVLLTFSVPQSLAYQFERDKIFLDERKSSAFFRTIYREWRKLAIENRGRVFDLLGDD